MHILIPYLITAVMLMVGIFTMGGDMLHTFETFSESWTALQERSERRADTRVSGPVGLSVAATSTVQITLRNRGGVPLGQFEDWDVIFEVQKSPGVGISYLSYTASSTPAVGQWTVQGIYLNAASSTEEIVDPGIFNPGEEMVALASPSPPVVANTDDRATFVTPNGVVVKVIFAVLP